MSPFSLEKWLILPQPCVTIKKNLLVETTMENKKKWYQKTLVILALLVFFFPIGLFLMWKYANWNKSTKWIITGIIASLIFLSASDNPKTTTQNNQSTSDKATKNETTKEEISPTVVQPSPTSAGFPNLSTETMDKDFYFSCAGGDEVTLWDKPTGGGEGSRPRAKVPCGTFAWAFNTYHNEQFNVTFYAVQTNDSRLEKMVYGWVTEDLISWR